MNLAAETHRYEDQFFQFDQTLYQNRYTTSRNHSITDNAEPDYGNDLVNEKFDNENISNELDNEEFNNEGLKDLDLDEDDEAGTDPNRHL